MRIQIRVRTRSKKQAVEDCGNGLYVVRVHAVPEDGKANDAVIGLLADFFDVGKSHVQIVKGITSRDKIIEID